MSLAHDTFALEVGVDVLVLAQRGAKDIGSYSRRGLARKSSDM